MSGRILVLGSLNMDFVVKVNHLPAPGETVLGSGMQMIPGGKGANQALAVARLCGRDTKAQLIGRVGRDAFGKQLKANLQSAGVRVESVTETDAPTGTAFIWVDSKGENSIVVAPGANHAFPEAEARSLESEFHGTTYLLTQLETPLKTVERAMVGARKAGVKTILDPAPAQTLSRDLLAEVDILTPNEAEACQLLGRPVRRVDRAAASKLAVELLALGPGAVVIKMGDQGCYYCSHHDECYCPAFASEVVDTTAAGDVFKAALAVALAEEQTTGRALQFANAAAALSVRSLGAQSSIPTRAHVDAFLRSSN